MKTPLYGNRSFEQILALNCVIIGVDASGLADEDNDFDKKDALYALRGAVVSGINDSKYKPYYEKYDRSMDEIIADLMPALENWLRNKADFNQKAYRILAFCYMTKGDFESGNCILDIFLQQEEQGMKVETRWIDLCMLSGFEEWHDNKYGNPIIDQPIKNTNNNSAYGETQTSSGGGCYIATSVYGSYDCPEVWTLRRYRDYKLARTFWGRFFIRVYYAVSPAIVRWTGDTKWFDKIWRYRLDKMVQSLRDEGFDSTPYKDMDW